MPLYLYTFKGLQKVKFISLRYIFLYIYIYICILKFEIVAGIQLKVLKHVFQN